MPWGVQVERVSRRNNLPYFLAHSAKVIHGVTFGIWRAFPMKGRPGGPGGRFSFLRVTYRHRIRMRTPTAVDLNGIASFIEENSVGSVFIVGHCMKTQWQMLLNIALWGNRDRWTPKSHTVPYLKDHSDSYSLKLTSQQRLICSAWGIESSAMTGLK